MKKGWVWKLSLFNRKYKVVLKFPYRCDADRVSLALASCGIKTKRTRDNGFDHRIKCWFQDKEEFKASIGVIMKSRIEVGIVK